MGRRHLAACFAACCLSLGGSGPGAAEPPPAPPDVVIVGAGIAGIAAALEANALGARVLVVDANSVGGGHAVKAGGLALVGTPLQAARGYRDDPDTAYRDLMAWGEDANPDWVRRYVNASGPEVHDWLAALGVRFTFILETPEHSVPRFHFAGGSARNVVVPMLAAALDRPGIGFQWNTEAVGMQQDGQGSLDLRLRDLRTGAITVVKARAVILATGGYESNLAEVRATWNPRIPAPARLYAGAGQYARGTGLDLARSVGARITRLDHQTIFTTGLPDPADATGQRALLTQNPAAIWVNARGQRFVNERASTKVADAAVLALAPATHWLVFDEPGRKSLAIRGAVWLADPGAPATLASSPYLHQADSLEALAAATGLPPATLAATVQRYNAAVASGTDGEFGRFAAGRPDKFARAIAEPPFHAIQLFPLTRKSMGGVEVDARAQALDDRGRAIPGLYAAGEVTGVAGINGSYGGEGTFLGPSVFMGRIAGASAARDTGARPASPQVPADPAGAAGAAPGGVAVTMTPEALSALVAAQRPGYWHFGEVHRTVQARSLDCAGCHSPQWPTRTPASGPEWQAALKSCATCH